MGSVDVIDNRTIMLNLRFKRVVSFKIEEEYVDALDKYASMKGCSRSRLLASLVKAISFILRQQDYKTSKIIVTGIDEGGNRSSVIINFLG